MPFWSATRSAATAPGGQLGPLEWRVLEALWACDAPATVRDLTPAFPETAYTTVMTTLDRLYRKGVLQRRKSGRAFEYWPTLDQSEFERARAAQAFRHALDRTGGSLAPLVSCLIDAVGDRDVELLDELEALLSARREADKDRQS
jgi:predicted transcriptional regulator